MTASQVYECSELPFLKSEWGFPYREWNQTRPFTLITGQLYKCEDFRLLQSGCYTIQLQGSLLYADSHPIIHELIPILYKWLLAKYPSIKTYAFSKVSVKLWNYRVPPPPWMKWNTSLNYNCGRSIQVGKDLHSPKLYILVFRGSEMTILIHNFQGLRL